MANTRERQERKRCLQCHGSTIHLITERKLDSGDWEEVLTRRACGHRAEEDPDTARPLLRTDRFDADGRRIS